MVNKLHGSFLETVAIWISSTLVFPQALHQNYFLGQAYTKSTNKNCNCNGASLENQLIPSYFNKCRFVTCFEWIVVSLMNFFIIW